MQSESASPLTCVEDKRAVACSLIKPCHDNNMSSSEATLLPPLAILLFATSTWFVVRHAKRGTSFAVLLLSIASFGLGSAAVALLPIDLSYSYAASATAASNNSTTNAEIDDVINDESLEAAVDTNPSANPTYLPWRVTYWTSFLLAYFILPIARETLLSGHFSLISRLKDGTYQSLRSMLLQLCCGIISIFAMAVHLKTFHFVKIVIPVLMALSNTYGLLLVSLLLGNGLVNIPKKLWRMACPANELRRVRIVSCGAEEELFEAIMALEDVEDRIEEVCRTAVSLRPLTEDNDGEGDIVIMGQQQQQRRGRKCSGIRRCCGGADEVTEFHESLEILVRQKNETAHLCSERRTRSVTTGGERSSSSPTRRRVSRGDDDTEDTEYDGGAINTMDLKTLISLSGQLKMTQERVTSAQLQWNHLMEHSRLFSSLMNDDDVTNRMQRLWVRYLRYPTYRCIALFTAILSIFVLVSEVTLSVPLNLSPFSWTLYALNNYQYQNSSTRILFQIAALIPLLYMSICVYTCLFQMSLLGPYCLRGNRQSNGVALVFNAQYLARLQFSLGYNYLLMLKFDMTHCAFNDIMSDMSTIPFFGTSFTVYAPLVILAVCLFTLCDVYPRILRFLGIDHEDALLLGDADELDAKVNEGIQLMKRDAERRGAELELSELGNSSVSTSLEKQSLNGRKGPPSMAFTTDSRNVLV